MKRLTAWAAKCCISVPYVSRAFLIDDGGVQPLAHHRYVALVRGEAIAPEFAGYRYILVDWYLRLACGQPDAVVNETCSWLVFDTQGAVDRHAAHAIDAVATPTDAQWATLRTLVFGSPAATTNEGVTP